MKANFCDNDYDLLELELSFVPQKGDIIFIDSDKYIVVQVIWSFHKDEKDEDFVNIRLAKND